MQIADNTVVSIDYTLTGDDAQVIDSSQGREPLKYLHGAGQIVPGLEQALTGKQAGDEVKVEVAPEGAYGPRDEQLVQQVPRDAFQGVEKVEAGMQFQAQTPQGPRVVTVAAVDEEQVTVDANHPLAGRTLHFEVAVREVREATEEEQQQGHAH